MSWTTLPLGKVVELKRGFDLPKQSRVEGPYPIFSSSGCSGCHIQPAVDGPCVTTGRYGTIGEVFFSEGPCWPLNTSLYATDFKGNSPRFVYYLLKQFPWDEFSTASAVPDINRNHINGHRVDIPDLATQNAIVAVLGALDDKIALNTRMNGCLEELLDAQFAELSKTGTSQKQLSEVLDVLSGGTPKTKIHEYWDDGSIPFFGPSDAGSCMYTLETAKHITETGLENCNSDLYPVGTVFLTARGTVGKVAIAGRPMAMNQSCFALCGKTVPQTAVYFLIKYAVRSLSVKANGATFAALNMRDLNSEVLSVPSASGLETFDLWSKPIYAAMLRNEKESELLAALRDALLPKLMSGEIDVSEVDVA